MIAVGIVLLWGLLLHLAPGVHLLLLNKPERWAVVRAPVGRVSVLRSGNRVHEVPFSLVLGPWRFIVLPPREQTTQPLRWIIDHEIGHFRHHHHVKKWLACCLLVGFTPLVRKWYRKMEAEANAYAAAQAIKVQPGPVLRRVQGRKT